MPIPCRHCYSQAARSKCPSASLSALPRHIPGRSGVQGYVERRDLACLWHHLTVSSAKGELGYSHLEKLQNLEMLPADGFEIVCCPIEVHRASAGWTRAVTILPA
jgi:hypothetical protein